jgi:hypothetical protein
MRSDMVPGAIFPDYELSDHTAKHRGKWGRQIGIASKSLTALTFNKGLHPVWDAGKPNANNSNAQASSERK